MKYRAEIDGLRALAVVPVILFHAGFSWFSGGYIGVDIFFVISGYLITTILIEDIENSQFSIVKFYERRARRILPALFFVMLVCLPFAWMWMLPNQMKDFSRSLIAVSLFVSNMFFGIESGYFDGVAEEKPLLHTWSLAVEEQYYLTFPLFLIFAWRYGKSNLIWLLALFAAMSLVLSELGWRHKPVENFFFGPSRAWELYAGSFAAILVQKNGVQKNNVYALLGVAAIVFAIIVYDENTPFPSLYALLPVLGTVLLVLYADKETIVAKVLSAKAVVGMGLISYSAYLWHQPILAFARIKWGEALNPPVMFALCCLAILLAYFSWRYVEKPFRTINKISGRSIFSLSIVGILFFISLGLVGTHYNGFETRFTRNVKGVVGHDHFQTYFKENGFIDCSQSFSQDTQLNSCTATKEGEPDIIIIGDSHGRHLLPGFFERFKDKNIMLLYLDGKPYLGREEFSYLVNVLETQITKKIVLLAMGFAPRLRKDNDLKQGYEANIEILSKGEHEIFLLEDIPVYKIDAEACLYAHTDGRVPRECSMSIKALQKQKNIYLDTLSDLSKKYDLPVINIDEELCDPHQCSMVLEGHIFYADDDHLNVAGSLLISHTLKQNVDKHLSSVK